MDTAVPYLREIRPNEKEKNASEYPFDIPALHLHHLHLRFTSPVTFLVGENGSGKSTLLEALAIGSGFNPGGGTKNTLNEQRRSESVLHEHLTFTWRKKVCDGFFLRAESFFNFGTYLEDWQRETGKNFHKSYGEKSLHEQSHGESFMALMKNRFQEGLFLLDEPEAALSPMRQLAFLSLMHPLVRSGKSQFVIATHSPILLAYPGAAILLFGADGMKEVAYEETEHYNVTKDFLNGREVFFRNLFEG